MNYYGIYFLYFIFSVCPSVFQIQIINLELFKETISIEFVFCFLNFLKSLANKTFGHSRKPNILKIGTVKIRP